MNLYQHAYEKIADYLITNFAQYSNIEDLFLNVTPHELKNMYFNKENSKKDEDRHGIYNAAFKHLIKYLEKKYPL